MQIITNNFNIERIKIILERINISEPGTRRWRQSDKFSSGIDYGETIRSTFPWYIKFAYLKRPNDWYLFTEDEKILEEIYFQYNTKEIVRILKKILDNKKLTNIQGLFVEQLFINFRQEELDFFEEFQEEMIIIEELENCPF